jgi:hypothetical protein
MRPAGSFAAPTLSYLRQLFQPSDSKTLHGRTKLSAGAVKAGDGDDNTDDYPRHQCSDSVVASGSSWQVRLLVLTLRLGAGPGIDACCRC